ncbi:MAG: hypothetical protein ACXU87_12780 [Xanthobacteraceae bacterium]
MTSTITHFSAVMAGLAVIATAFTVSRNGLLPGLIAAVVLGVAAAALLTIARGIT